MQLILVKLKARNAEAVKFQEVLTKHGCNIALRLGLHEMSGTECSNEGLIILQVKPDGQAVESLVADLRAIGPEDQLAIKTVSL